MEPVVGYCSVHTTHNQNLTTCKHINLRACKSASTSCLNWAERPQQTRCGSAMVVRHFFCGLETRRLGVARIIGRLKIDQQKQRHKLKGLIFELRSICWQTGAFLANRSATLARFSILDTKKDHTRLIDKKPRDMKHSVHLRKCPRRLALCPASATRV